MYNTPQNGFVDGADLESKGRGEYHPIDFTYSEEGPVDLRPVEFNEVEHVLLQEELKV